jgi:hypothetical protein
VTETVGIVTNADLYRELLAMRVDVGKALTRIEVIDNRNTAADRIHADFEIRIRALEAFKWKLAGGALTMAAAAGIISGAVAAHIH